MSSAQHKGYRRSWKNLLLNKRYQLSFTLFMVGLSAVLMTLLGYCVVDEAQKASKVSENLMDLCPEVPEVIPVAGGGNLLINEGGEAVAQPEAAPPAEPENPPAEAAVEAAPGQWEEQPAEAATDDAAAEPEGPAGEAVAGQPIEDRESRPHIVVEVGSLTMHDDPPFGAGAVAVPPDFVNAVAERALCQVQQMGQLAELRAGYQRILAVLVTSEVLLIVGLLFYGIKMTHRVAGPLHKVELYFEKMKRGVYDPVYDLRKGDQLVEFYDHFKAAHVGLVAMQKEDIAHLRAALDAAERAELAGRSPELAAALDDMRAILARKEKSLE